AATPRHTATRIPLAEEVAAGKALRERVPRLKQGVWKRVKGQVDPIEILLASDADRVPELVPIKYGRMLQSPFAFYRGTAALMAADLAHTPVSGLRVQACGDAHLMNFGGFATPERNLAFDVNDFDETFPAPWEWDVKRLCASLVLAARWRGFSTGQAREAANAAVSRYRERMTVFADMPTMEVWYSRLNLLDLVAQARGDRRLARLVDRDIRRAQTNSSEHVYGKITATVNGVTRIIDQPPLLSHPNQDLQALGEEFLKQYGVTLREDFRALLQRFRLVDAALKVVGVGSVGTRCYIVLLLGEHNEPLFLQVKEARRSVLEMHAGPSPWRNQGERVVAGQHLMQAVSDIFLGWARGPEGRDFYVRQLRDMKIAAEIDQLDAPELALYGRLCGGALARAHAKAGQSPAIAGYLGASDAFDDAIAKYSLAYADQIERDYETFRAAIRSGRLRTETSALLVETMIA
ncbi:MAG: DUF2252 domain-containing protein, partial [Stellaceae bacterium]